MTNTTNFDTIEPTISGNFLNHHVKVALPLSDRKIAIPISATAKAFIDFGKIKRENIIKRGDRLEIILPDPVSSVPFDAKSLPLPCRLPS